MPEINKEDFHKEIQRLVGIVVLTIVHHSQYGTPVCIIPKKGGTMRFITDYQNINHTIVRKPYPLPRIGDTMQKLELFYFATALDRNMRYYTIYILPKSRDLTTIVTNF